MKESMRFFLYHQSKSAEVQDKSNAKRSYHVCQIRPLCRNNLRSKCPWWAQVRVELSRLELIATDKCFKNG